MLSFSQYFQEWLYAENGYYTQYKTIGKSGDFFTSVSTSKFFGGAIANKIIKLYQDGVIDEDFYIVEIGAHHGYLLADIIEFIYTLEPKLLSSMKFAIVERSKELQKHQKEYFVSAFGDAVNLVFFDDISTFKVDKAFIVANEIFDAFKCEIVHKKDDILYKLYVDKHKLKFIQNDDQELSQIAKQYNITKGEIGLGYEEFFAHLTANIARFEFITFDYGEFLPRGDISTRIYSKHQVFPLFEDDLELEPLFQRSDITYDVHFQRLIDIANSFGIENIAYSTQLKALVEFGIIELLDMVQQNASYNDYIRETNKVKTLLDPTVGMGERFKMCHFRYVSDK